MPSLCLRLVDCCRLDRPIWQGSSDLVDLLELPWEARGIEEWSKVKPYSAGLTDANANTNAKR